MVMVGEGEVKGEGRRVKVEAKGGGDRRWRRVSVWVEEVKGGGRRGRRA